MDIMFSNGAFAVPLGVIRQYQYEWNKDGSLSVSSENEADRPIRVTTGRGDFIEAVNDVGEIIASGGDGHWFHVLVGTRPVTLRSKALPKIALSKAAMQKARQTVQRYLLSDAPYSLDLPDTLTGVIEWMQAKLQEIPAGSREMAEFSFGTTMEYGETYPRIEITYTEPETDEELHRRLQVASARASICEAEERAQLAALKAKFDSAA